MSTKEPRAAETGTWFAYIYFMTSDKQSVRRIAPAHAEYWRQLHITGYTGGPFADRSGGLITFLARDHEQARGLIDADPFEREGLLESRWLKEWEAQPADG